MKYLRSWMVGAALLCAAAVGSLHADELPPGQVDFGAFSPPKGGGEFVEVDVPAPLLNFASQIVAKDEPDVAKLLGGLKRVQVNVIGLDEENRADLEKRAQKIRNELKGDGWERVVSVQEKDQDISVHLKLNDKGAVEGLVAVVLDGKDEAVFANVVGEIKPDQLAMLGEKLHIDPLKKFEAKSKEKSEDKSSADKS